MAHGGMANFGELLSSCLAVVDRVGYIVTPEVRISEQVVGGEAT